MSDKLKGKSELFLGIPGPGWGLIICVLSAIIGWGGLLYFFGWASLIVGVIIVFISVVAISRN